jgi:hypothetical protein
MSESHDVFEVSELQVLSHTCSKCGNEITFNVLTHEAYGFPKNCYFCQEPMDGAVTAFVAYRKFYNAATANGATVRLRTKARKDEA